MIGLFRRKDKVSHKHYFYTSLFNNVFIEYKMHDCCLDIDEQRNLYNTQCEKPVKNLPDKYRFLLYYGRECCIYCTLTKDVKRSSDATATTSGFIVRNYSKNELLEGSTDQVFVQKEEIDQVFDDSFLSSSSTGKLFDDVTCSLVKLKEKQASREDIEVICGMICSGQETLMQMKLNYETPYNEWLYKLLMKNLNQYNFVIYERNKGCP